MKKTTKDNNQIQAKNSEHIQEILSQNLNIYRLIAENMYDAIYTLDTNVNFSFVNDVALKRSGYTRKWFIGRSFLNFVNPENKNMVQKSFKSVMMGKVVPAYELSYINSKGKSLWIEINATPLADNGNIIGVLVVSRDITERKRNEEELKLYRNNLESLIEGRTAELRIANEQLQIEIAQHKKTEEALRSSEAYYRTIFHNTGTAIIIMEDDTTISLSNAECEKFVGYRASDLEGKRRAVEFVARQDLERILSYNELRRQDPEKAPRSYELKIVDRHGNVRDVLITIASIPHTNKTIASFLDITEQKKMEAALKASEEKYRNIFENAVEGIFQIGINGEILSANPSFSHLFGYKSPQEIMRAVKDIRYEIYADESQRKDRKSVV